MSRVNENSRNGYLRKLGAGMLAFICTSAISWDLKMTHDTARKVDQLIMTSGDRWTGTMMQAYSAELRANNPGHNVPSVSEIRKRFPVAITGMNP